MAIIKKKVSELSLATVMAFNLKLNIPVNVKQFGAIGDNTSHPLSELYTTLEDAQAVYGFATSLTDELDWAAFQKAVNSVGTSKSIYIPDGDYIINKSITITENYTNIYCNGRLRNTGSTSCIIIDASWCKFKDLYFIGGTNAAVEIINASLQNVFYHTTFDNVGNYGFVINNAGTGKPAYTAIHGVNMIYTNGIIKNLCESEYAHEFTISNVHFTNCPVITDFDAFPAAIWCRNIHDILISDLMGASYSGVFFFEGDCDGQVSNFNVTSIQRNSLIIKKYGISVPRNFTFSNFLIWGANTDLEGYTDIAAIELYGVKSIHFTDAKIANMKWGIKQGVGGTYYFSNMSCYDCDDFIKFDYFPVGEVATPTYINVDNSHFYGNAKSRNLLASTLDYGYKQAVTLIFNKCKIEVPKVWNFDPFDQCLRVEFNDCVLPSNVNDLLAFVNNHKGGIPTFGIYPVGYQIGNDTPAPTEYMNQVCVTGGALTSGAWVQNTVYVAGTWVNNGTLAFKCITGGTSGTVAPTSGTIGALITDNTVTWQYMVNTLATFKGTGLIES